MEAVAFGSYLLWAGRAGDDRSHLIEGKQPSDRKLQKRSTSRLGEHGERLDPVVGGVGEVFGMGREPGAGRRPLAPPVLAGERPARQREVRDVRKPELRGPDEPVGLVGTVEQAQLVLDAHKTRGALGDRVGGLALLARTEVGAADLTDHARLHQLVERRERVGDRNRRVRLVQLVEIDRLDLQPVQAVGNRALDVVGRGARLAGRDLHAELGRHHEPVAAALQNPPEELLALGAAVDVGRIEEGDARIE